MTALAHPLVEAPAEPLYSSPRGLYGFQEEDIARAYLAQEKGGGNLCVWDTGMGKSHLAMALAGFMFEDGLIDHVILVADLQKIADDEWPSDWGKYTRLTYARHHGSGRMDRLAKRGLPQVLITTYETGKADLARFVRASGKGRRGTSTQNGPLLDLLIGRRVLIIFDESTKLKNRSSGNYKAWEHALKRLRKAATTRVLGLTATPIEKDYEDAFNQLRLVAPTAMPLVGEFEEYFVRNRDPYGRPRYYAERMHEFAALARPLMLVRRKTDPDVIAEFPKQVEEARWFEMAPDQRDLYEMVCDLQQPDPETGQMEIVPGLSTVKRMVAGHPAALIHSATYGTSKIARLLVEELGEEYLRSVSSVKEQGLVDYLTPLVKGQGAKALVFSFFGPSMLPLLAARLRDEKFRVYVTHGQMGLDEVAQARSAFKADTEPAVLLSSDAGARGINLPEATYVVEYESALTYAMRTQRINRIHRIDSLAPSVTCMTFFVRESIEAAIAQGMAERNCQHDVLLGDEDAENYVTAAEREVALEISRNRRRRRNPK